MNAEIVSGAFVLGREPMPSGRAEATDPAGGLC